MTKIFIGNIKIIIDSRNVKHFRFDVLYKNIPVDGHKLTLHPLSDTTVYVKGMSDHEFSVEVEKLFRLAGCLGLFRIYGGTMEAYMGSILAGENACEPSPYDFALGGAGMHPSLPLGHNGSALKEGQTVMVDINGNFTGYISDQSRTYSVGKLPQYAYDAHQVSIEIQDAIAEQGKPGVTCEELYQRYGNNSCYNGYCRLYVV